MSDEQRPTQDPKAQGGEHRRLERAPGERYERGTADPGGPRSPAAAGATAPGATAPAGRARPLVAAVVVADLGGLAFFLLGLLDLGPGLIAVAAFLGWVTALALVWRGRGAIADVRLRTALAAFLGGWAVVLGILIDWIYSVVAQPGVLGPLDYVIERYGWVAPLSVLAAAAVAALRAH